MRRLGTVLGVLLMGIAALGGTLVSLAIALSLWTPALREHCITPTSTSVESHWSVNLLSLVGATDVVSKDKLCIRNTPLREGLSAIGVWKLGTPEEQFRKMLADAQD